MDLISLCGETTPLFVHLEWNAKSIHFTFNFSTPPTNKTSLFSGIDFDLGRYDNSRQFKIFDNVYVGDRFIDLSKDFDVTLATQSSLDRLHWLIYVAKFWSGPISIAVFVPGTS